MKIEMKLKFGILSTSNPVIFNLMPYNLNNIASHDIKY